MYTLFNTSHVNNIIYLKIFQNKSSVNHINAEKNNETEDLRLNTTS